MFQVADWDYSTGLDMERTLVQPAIVPLPENRTRVVTTIIVRCSCLLHCGF